MTDQDIHDAIYNLSAAKALADAGNDSGAAAAVNTAGTLPPTIISTTTTEGGVMTILGPTLGDQALTAIEAVAAATTPGTYSSILTRIIRLLRVGYPSGVDFGNPDVRSMLDTLQAASILPAQAVSLLKAAAQVPTTIAASEVSRVWAQYRPNGQITGQPS